MSKKNPRILPLLSVSVLTSWGLVGLASSPSSFADGLPDSASRSTPTLISQNRTSPPVPPLPDPLPTPRVPNSEGIVGLIPTPEDDIGIGHLRPKDIAFLEEANWAENPMLGAGWLQSAAIPVYIEPNGSHWGWILNGWLVPNGQPPIALGQDASFSMLQTYFDLLSFPVKEIREDGWFQFQYTSAGSAWAHIDHLNLGRIDLVVESWENRFAQTSVTFRNHGLSQALYEVPGADTEILELIGPDSYIEPLAFEGDWMRVRVTEPTDGCTFLPGAVTQEGWMRWRDSNDQSLVWFSPKGC